MQPLVSVVVPVFNGLPYLRDLMASLLAQDYSNLELIFTEGGGTDASLDFLRTQTDPRVRLIAMPRGTSAAENWTAATMQARGEFIKLVCQDDLIYPTAISRQVNDLVVHPEAVMATAQRDIIDAQGNILFKRRGLTGVAAHTGETVHGHQLIHTCYLQGTNVIGEPLAVLFRRQALQEAMPWEDANPLMLDLSTYTKVAPLGDAVIRREAVGAFRVSASSWSTRLAKVQREQTKQWQETYASTKGQPISTKQQRRARLGRHQQTMLRRIAYAVMRARGVLHPKQTNP